MKKVILITLAALILYILTHRSSDYVSCPRGQQPTRMAGGSVMCTVIRRR